MRKHTEEIKRIERGRVMLYSEFPTIFDEMPDGVKETWQGSEKVKNELGLNCPVEFANCV